MDIFTRHHLQELIENQHRPCVSIFLPTHRAGSETRQDPIRFKNLVNQAEEQLAAGGMAATAARRLLEPARQLQAESNPDFWRHQDDGLALFADESRMRYWRVPLPVEEKVCVEDRFFVKPLLPLIEGDGSFYLLAVSQNEVRLLQGSRYSVSEITPDTLPKNMVEALNIDEYVESLQFLSYRPQGARAGEVQFHGQGASNLDRKKSDELEQYFHRLSDALQDFFGPETTPLVFAGVEYLFPIFRKCSHYRMLLDTPVTGNPELLSAEQLHAQAWAIVEPIFENKQRAALEQYGERAARNLASDDLQEIIAATREGAVETLLLQQDAAAWGSIDAGGEVHEHAVAGSDSRDLFDYAAAQTVVNSGSVFVLEGEKMPTDHPAAAVLRYPVTWPAKAH